ncbi:DUF5615 family PIN-like protein [Lichenibacterium dinghuense]|uniref:DUF5615 family PIN-like protein n=1 Tax=Lichenibacterium dinghuense TaxID=2895977 RepID=UPI001F2F4D7A|nr:DUF5615 family PIN-like protein [Lichenibacterium sp. 6Y81]
MKVVVDEGVPRQIVAALRRHGIDAERFPGRWAAMRNGDLLDAAVAAGFDAVLTNDKNISDQNSLRDRPLAVVALPHNRRRPILDRVDDVADTLRRAQPHQHIVIGLDGSRIVTSMTGGRAVTESLPALKPFEF